MLHREVKYTAHIMSYHAFVETMGERIKALREARGMSQTDLGKRVGVTKSAVSQWETGSTANIKLPTFLALIEALHTDMAYLVYGPSRGPSRTHTPRTGHG